MVTWLHCNHVTICGYLRIFVIGARLQSVLVYERFLLGAIGVVALRGGEGPHQRVFTWKNTPEVPL